LWGVWGDGGVGVVLFDGGGDVGSDPQSKPRAAKATGGGRLCSLYSTPALRPLLSFSTLIDNP